MTLNFDPNNKKPPIIEWATYIPSRSTVPRFKRHTNRGHALNAIGWSDAILYHWEDGEWKEVFRQENFSPPETCDCCGKNIKEVKQYGTYFRGEAVWINKKELVPARAFYCYECRRNAK